MTRRLPSDAGLSLVEIMVALFIVGLTTSFVVISLPRANQPLERFKTDLTRQLETLRTLSVTTGEPFGVELDDNTSRAIVFRRGEWIETGVIGELSRVIAPEDVDFDLLEEPRRQFEKSRILNDDETDPIIPDIWFDPSGIATTQDLAIRTETDDDHLISFSRTGRVNVIRTQ